MDDTIAQLEAELQQKQEKHKGNKDKQDMLRQLHDLRVNLLEAWKEFMSFPPEQREEMGEQIMLDWDDFLKEQMKSSDPNTREAAKEMLDKIKNSKPKTVN
jgi:hypothetical protein